jgi:hypothetical protein
MINPDFFIEARLSRLILKFTICTTHRQDQPALCSPAASFRPKVPCTAYAAQATPNDWMRGERIVPHEVRSSEDDRNDVAPIGGRPKQDTNSSNWGMMQARQEKMQIWLYETGWLWLGCGIGRTSSDATLSCWWRRIVVWQSIRMRHAVLEKTSETL